MPGLQKHWSRVIPVGLFVLEFFYLAYIHSWEVDPHHDGIMYTAAVGVYEGKVPNRDFFTQYGPVTPLIQGFWFRIFGPTLFSLKILTGLGLALIGILLYVAARRKYSIYLSTLLSICWVLTGPFGLPWSSIFSTIFILISLLLLQRNFDASSLRTNSLSGFLVGFFLAVGTFTRIQTLLVYVAVFFALLFFDTKSKYQSLIARVSLGYFATVFSILLALANLNALKPFFDQCILWAAMNYGGGPKVSVSFFFNLAWIPFYGLVSLFVIYALQRLISRGVGLINLIALALSTVYLVLTLLSFLERTGPQTLRNPKVLGVIAGEKSYFIFNFTVLTLFFFVTLYLFIKSWSGGKFDRHKIGIDNCVYLVVALASSLQLYPYTDEYHIAFISPILLAALFFLVSDFINPSLYSKPLTIFIAALIPALLVQFISVASIPRNEFRSKTFAGIYGSWASAESLDLTLKKLEKESPGIRFICADGIYAGAGGKYLSIDEKFVTWGPDSQGEAQANRLFLCYSDQKTMDTYVSAGWKVKFKVLWKPMTGHSNGSHWNVLLENSPSI
jgi:hypothetical protein